MAGDRLGGEAALVEEGVACATGAALSRGEAAGGAVVDTFPTVNPALCRVIVTLPRGRPMKLGITNPGSDGV